MFKKISFLLANLHMKQLILIFQCETSMISFTRLLYFKNYIYFTRLKFKKLMIPKPINQIRIP